MFDPQQLPENKLLQALNDLGRVDRVGITQVDVTSVFSHELDGITSSALRAQMEQLGMDWPSSAPQLGKHSGGIAIDYEIGRRVLENRFQPYDVVAVFFDTRSDDTLQVTRATWGNTSAFP